MSAMTDSYESFRVIVSHMAVRSDRLLKTPAIALLPTFFIEGI